MCGFGSKSIFVQVLIIIRITLGLLDFKIGLLTKKNKTLLVGFRLPIFTLFQSMWWISQYLCHICVLRALFLLTQCCSPIPDLFLPLLKPQSPIHLLAEPSSPPHARLESTLPQACLDLLMMNDEWLGSTRPQYRKRLVWCHLNHSSGESLVLLSYISSRSPGCSPAEMEELAGAVALQA